MSSKISCESSRETLLPIEEREMEVRDTRKPRGPQRVYDLVFKRRFFTNGVSIIHQSIIIILFVFAINVAYHQGLVSEPSARVKSFVPQIGPASGPVTFTDSPDWSGNTSQAAENWNKWLVNFETHTIALSEEAIAEFGYEPGLYDTEHSERFGISMFHQLHCLATIREFAYLPDALRMPDGKPLDHDGVSFSGFHMDHCFNYLRQAIECYADSTVEWAKINEQGHRKGIQGWGIPHYQCRDRDTLEAFAIAHHNL